MIFILILQGIAAGRDTETGKDSGMLEQGTSGKETLEPSEEIVRKDESSFVADMNALVSRTLPPIPNVSSKLDITSVFTASTSKRILKTGNSPRPD